MTHGSKQKTQSVSDVGHLSVFDWLTFDMTFDLMILYNMFSVVRYTREGVCSFFLFLTRQRKELRSFNRVQIIEEKSAFWYSNTYKCVLVSRVYGRGSWTSSSWCWWFRSFTFLIRFVPDDKRTPVVNQLYVCLHFAFDRVDCEDTAVQRNINLFTLLKAAVFPLSLSLWSLLIQLHIAGRSAENMFFISFVEKVWRVKLSLFFFFWCVCVVFMLTS